MNQYIQISLGAILVNKRRQELLNTPHLTDVHTLISDEDFFRIWTSWQTSAGLTKQTTSPSNDNGGKGE